MIPSLDRRLRRLRSRVLVRSWEYRQRRHARGVWFRLRRVLADASEARAISCDEARKLIEEGRREEPVGHELEPPKLIVFAPAERVAQIASARLLPVRLSAGKLSTPYLRRTLPELRMGGCACRRWGRLLPANRGDRALTASWPSFRRGRTAST